MGKVLALNMKSILNRFIKCVLVKQIDWNNFFWLFEKNGFFMFLTQHLISKKENFKKWEKMSFDSIFELAIVILVGIEYLIVKIGWKVWFLQLFFLG